MSFLYLHFNFSSKAVTRFSKTIKSAVLLYFPLLWVCLLFSRIFDVFFLKFSGKFSFVLFF